MYEKLVADVEFLEGNTEAAAKMYLEGARDGDALASFNYGYCLLCGYGVQPNPREAKSFFAFSKEMEGGEAAYNLAVMYIKGNGVKKDYKKAIDYMSLSASQGCIEAQLYMGVAHTQGCVFDPDIVRISMIPYHKAEYETALPELDGFISDYGEIERDEDQRYSAVKQDARAAFEYFRAAARHDPTYVEQLSAKGKYLYARCYVDGLGTDYDREKSLRLMAAAGKSGSSEAILYFQENGITPEEISALTKPKKLAGGR